MKNKLFIIVLLLIIGGKSIAQVDTLNVYLEKSQKHKYGVYLVFENNSNDTIFLLTKFRNLSLGGEIPRVPGICINFYSDNEKFTFNWGELPPLVFNFPNKYTLINPKSKTKLFFNVGEYFKFPEKSDKKFEVSFLINYMFSKYQSSELPKIIDYFETNRVTIVESTKETEAHDRDGDCKK